MPRKKKSPEPKPMSSLRDRAEALLRARPSDTPTLPTRDVQALLYELGVHETELEIQNEELRRAQIELSESHDRYADLYEFAPVGYATLNPESLILEANLALATMLGVERRKLTGTPLEKYIARDSQDDFYLHRREVFGGDGKFSCGVELVRPDGERMGVRLESVAFGPPGERRCRTAIVDVTASRRAMEELERLRGELERRVLERTEELRETNDRLRAILDTAADAIVTIDQRGIVTGVNPATERMFGYAAEEIVGRNVSMLMPSPYAEEHDGYLARYLRTGEARIIGTGREVAGRRKDGTVFPVDLAVSEVHDRVEVMFTGIVRDIGERKRLEEELLRINQEERTRISRELHDGVGQRMAGLAMTAKALGRRKPASERDAATLAELSDELQAAVKELRAVVQDLAPVELGPEGLMEAMFRLAGDVERRHGVACVVECPEPVALPEEGKAVQLYRIAQEAVHNALKHSGADRIEISLSGDDRGVLLTVEDRGRGFKPRSVADTEGLGLRIMRHRANLIGAKLTVASEPGGGTRVDCLVPKR